MKKWWRRRRWNKAVKILTREAQRHVDANHSMDFTAVNEGYLLMICRGCKDLQP